MMWDFVVQLFAPESSLLARVIAFGVLVAVITFTAMAKASMDDRRDSPAHRRAEMERDRRAEAIATAARRELTEQKREA